MLDIIIPSKNRANQCNFLIDSIHKNFKDFDFNITVLEIETDERYKQGYKKLQSQDAFLQRHTNFIIRTNYTKDIINILENSKNKYCCVITDDCVIYDEVEFSYGDKLDYLFDNGCKSFSLRLGYNTTLQKYWPPYKWQRPLVPESEYTDIITWKYSIYDYSTENYGRPISCDGNIHLKSDFLRWINQFKPLNTRELDAVKPNDIGDTISSFKTSKLISISNNLCFSGQADNYGHFNHISTEELNNKWLDNQKIIKVKLSPVISSHAEGEYVYG